MLIFASKRFQIHVGAHISLVAIYLVSYQSVITLPSRINQYSHLNVAGAEDFADQAWFW